jgi:hypothetical protein
MLMRLTVLIAFLAAAGLAPAVTAAQEAPSQKTIECACPKYCWVNGAESAMPWVLLRSSPDYRHAVVSQHAGVRC